MREAAPGKYKYEVEAAIEHVYLKSGAMSWGYPSIVGSGPNATILHYNKSNRKIELATSSWSMPQRTVCRIGSGWKFMTSRSRAR